MTDTSRIIAPPPLLYFGAFLLGYLIHRLLPLPMEPSLFKTAFGILLLLLSGAVVLWSVMTLRRMGTPVNPYKPSLTLATEGPYRHSRNPIYVGLTGLYLATALLLGWLWPLILLIPIIAIMHQGVILREERSLDATFGEQYRTYRAKVRRWM